MNYKDLLILRLSNLTEWKNEKEMIIPNDMGIDFYTSSCTCEFLGDGRCMLRGYLRNGGIDWTAEYQNGQKHGKYIVWYSTGGKWYEQDYKNGQRHGKYMEWDKNGKKDIRTDYKNGQVHGKRIRWFESGKKWYEEEYQNGKKIKQNYPPLPLGRGGCQKRS